MAYGDGYGGGYGGSGAFAVTVEVAFTTDPGDTPVWTDVSEYLKGFSVNRGRQRELDTFQAGRAQITLSNEDRRFDPTYAAGPYWPDVVPMRRVRIQATWGGTLYDVFTGYVDSWEQQYDPPQSATCVVSATDAFKVLANIELPASVYEEEAGIDSPAHWWRLSEPSGATVAYDSGTAPSSGTYVGGVSLGQEGAPTHDPDSAATFDGVDDYVTFGAGPVITAFPYTIELWLKLADRGGDIGDKMLMCQSRQTSGNAGKPWGWVTGNDLGGPGILVWGGCDTGSTRVDDGAWHHVVLVATALGAGGQKLYLDGALVSTGTAEAPGTGDVPELVFGLPPSWTGPISKEYWQGSLDEVTLYPGVALSAARISVHNDAGRVPWRNDLTGERAERILDAAGWPATDRLIDTGSVSSSLQSADLGGTALAVLQQIERTEVGALFITAAGKVRLVSRDSLFKAPFNTSQATFGDSGTDLEYADLTYEYDDQLIWNEILVSRSGGTVQVAVDTGSQDRYLRRSKVIDGLLHEDDDTSTDIANYVLSQYKDPELRVTGLRLEPSAGNETTHFPQVLGRELLDRVTVKRVPQNLGATIDQPARIEGIIHTVTATEWVTSWNLSTAETEAFWLAEVVGFGEAGVTTRAGF